VRRTFATVAVAPFLVVLLAPSAQAANAQVHIVGGAPNPAQITVDDGDTVSFVNDDNVEHAIFAQGVQRGATIPPHSTSEPFGPFQTGGQQGNFTYQVDRSGPSGTIVVRGPVTTSTTATTQPTTTTSPYATTVVPPSAAPETTVPETTTTLSSASPVDGVTVKSGRKDDSSSRFAVLGLVLLVSGIGGLILVAASRRRRSRQD
jgi:plastocyanin